MPQIPSYVPTRIPLPSVAYSLTIPMQLECTIPSGTAVSTTIDMTTPERTGYLPLIVVTPPAWTAAKLTLQLSIDGLVWKTIHKWFDNKSFTTDHTVQADDAVILDNHPLRGIPYYRFLSGTVATPVNQAATRTLVVYCGTH